MRTTNVIPFPMGQRNVGKPSVITKADIKPFLVVPKPAPANGLLDEFAIWAGRLGQKLVSYSSKRARLCNCERNTEILHCVQDEGY